MSSSINKYLFWILLFVCIFSFFNRNAARNVNEIAPEVLSAPVLKEADNKYPIELISKGFRYSLVPIYECEISGLIVDRLMFGLVTVGSVERGLDMNKNFTIMWGSNVSGRTYKNQAIKFSEGAVNWQGNAAINLAELARIALITKDRNLYDRMKGILNGDQIKIKGKLVNGSADKISPVGYCGNHLEWKSGTPEDNERFWTIYLEDIEILKKANVIYNCLFWISFFGLITLVIIHLFGPLRNYG